MSSPILFPVRPKIGEGAGIGVGPLNPTILLDETQPPFRQLDWPTPQPRKSYIMTTVASLGAADANIAFNQLDWPNPAPARKPALSWIQTRPQYYVDLSPNNQYNWPNPQLKGQQNKGFTIARPQNYTDLKPNNQYDWPVPAPNRFKPYTWTQNLLENTLAPIITVNPFSPPIYELPQPRKSWLLTELSSTVKIVPTEKPFIYPEFVTPKRKSYLITDISTTIQSSSDKPFVQNVQPNPLLKKLQTRTFINVQKPAEPDTVFMPCSVLDWPNPSPRKRPALTHIGQIAQLQQLNTRPVSILPVYPNRLDAKKSAITWIQGRPFYYVEPSINPFGNIEWKMVPPRKETLLISYVQKFTATTSIGNPFKQNEWPNPIRKKRLPEQWEFYYQQDDNLPFIAQIFNNPLRKGIQTLSWVQSPLVATPIAGAPFNKVIFDNPLLARKIAQSWLNSSLSVSELPILQFNWANPLTRNKLAETWIQNRPFYLEDLIPFSQNDYPNPQLVKISNRGYIFNQQIQEVTSPPTYDYPNPRLTERQTESWINNLLQSTLNPGAGDVPFYQNNWPVPDRKKIGLDWIFSRPFIFEVVAVPFVKSEWPNPEVIIRNPVGYINYLIPQEEVRISSVLDIPLKKKIEALTWLQNLQENTLGPLPVTSFTQKDWPNPLRGRRNQVGHVESRLNYITGNVPFALIDFKVPGKKGPAITYIYSSLINLNEVVGIQPFNQYDWPLVRGKGQQNKGFIIQGGYILPNIIGRIICLNADVTLYDLEAALQEFDLDATTTEYDLEAGGTECE